MSHDQPDSVRDEGDGQPQPHNRETTGSRADANSPAQQDANRSSMGEGGRIASAGTEAIPVDGDEQFAFVTRRELLAFSHSGPIPTGPVLRGIDEVVPGAAAAIVEQGNLNVAADRENERKYVDAITKLDIRGQWMAFVLTILFGAASASMFIAGITAGGVTFGLASLAPIVRSFLDRGTNTRTPREE